MTKCTLSWQEKTEQQKEQSNERVKDSQNKKAQEGMAEGEMETLAL